jgi:hypothetical protein
MTYGKRARVSGIIQGYSDINWIIGREFWAFVSDDENTSQELFDIASDVAEHHVPDGGESYNVRLERKIAELANQIETKYGTGEEMWKRLFDDNM